MACHYIQILRDTFLTLSNKKVLVYLPVDLLAALKIEAAQKGYMQYSDLISTYLSEAFSNLKDLKSFAELSEITQYTNILAACVPSKKGPPTGEKKNG
jgi:hypothetical protein